jgi:hypothetical protein
MTTARAARDLAHAPMIAARMIETIPITKRLSDIAPFRCSHPPNGPSSEAHTEQSAQKMVRDIRQDPSPPFDKDSPHWRMRSEAQPIQQKHITPPG